MRFFRKIIIPTVLLISGVSAFAQEETDDKLFIQFTDQIYDMGTEWSEAGYPGQASWYYGHAYAAMASFRTAIAEIARDKIKEQERQGLEDSVTYAQEQIEEDGDFLEFLGFDTGSFGKLLSGLTSFTESVEDFGEKVIDKMENLTEELGGYVFSDTTNKWLLIKSKSLASPYPDFFRGLVCDWRGEDDTANEFYKKTAANPYFIGFVFDFTFLADMDLNELEALSKSLAPYQSKYLGAMESDGFHFPYDMVTWSDDYLTGLAINEMNAETPDMSKAREYAEAAYRANPFNLRNIYNCVVFNANARDARATAKYLNEALRMDPDNKALENAVDAWNNL